MSAQAFFTDGQKKIHAPEVPSSEKGRRNKLNGMISVDANTCLEYLKLKEKSKIEDVSDYFLQCSQDFLREGFDKLTIILDQDLTDKKKMKSQLKFHLINAQISDKIVVDFIHTPTYSPNFNLVEYIIHLLRLKLLHHLSLDVNIQQVKDKLEKFFQFNQLQTPEQIQNIIRHICTLA